MASMVNEEGRRLLQVIFDQGAQSASRALSQWLGQLVRLVVSDVELVPLEQAAELLGPPESMVAACAMGLSGLLSGTILLVFEDRSGLALVDLLMQQPLGAASEWGEIEQSAAKETTNIIGCSYVGSLVAHLPSPRSAGVEGARATESQLIPTPPHFFHEFAGSLIEFALMDQLAELEHVLLIRTRFTREDAHPGLAQGDELDLNWTLLFVPSREALDVLSAMFGQVESNPARFQV